MYVCMYVCLRVLMLYPLHFQSHTCIYTYINVVRRPCFPLPQRYVPSSLLTRELEIYRLSDSEDEDITILTTEKRQKMGNGEYKDDETAEGVLKEYLLKRGIYPGGVSGGRGGQVGHKKKRMYNVVEV